VDQKTLSSVVATPSAIETEHLSRRVPDKILVNDISVQVRSGEILAIVGASGAGKTSFLRLLNRLDEPTGGTVRLNGHDYHELPAQELRRRVMQSAFLFPGTVAANVAFGPQQRGQRLSYEEIDTLLEGVDLPGYSERDVTVLSGGEAQRVSLARTLANAPAVLLLDEPTSALDEVSSRAIEELLLSIVRERQIACAIVTHNAGQAQRIADRTMIIEKGKSVSIGLTKEVLNAF
jgi:putative ABC transport system ATP-binding protein